MNTHKPTASNVLELTSLLARKGWQTRAQIEVALLWNPRFIRAVAQLAGNKIVRGQKGFNVIEKCTDDEIVEAMWQRFAQARKERETAEMYKAVLSERQMEVAA